ncbi:MAG: glutathione S-transferase N-terminal domain-containing protein [Betaproteobacteria bacterium]|nr:glutathione S-transferase N-terminal domain-containing protein [Betaproteobacteria bacterium]
MKLIGSVNSPYTRKVRVVFAEKKIDYDFVAVSHEEFGAKVTPSNPLSKVPVLILDDETPIFDSRVIVEYLDGVVHHDKLLPDSARECAEVRCWEALADGISDASVLVALEQRRPLEQQSGSWVQRQREKVEQGLAFIANSLNDGRSYCVGIHFSLADVAVGCMLGWLLLRLPEIKWQAEYPALAGFYERLMQRPSFVATRPSET